MPGVTGTTVIKSVLPSAAGLGATGSINGVIVESATDAIVAHAGGGQTLAVPLTSKLNRVGTVATTADSVLLPAAVAGATLKVVNAGANSMNVFPQANGDIINALAVNTAFAQAAANTTTYSCYTTGKWVTN